jgi:putative aldouronate transport system permease protein
MFRRNLVWFLMTLPAALWIFLFKYVTLAGISIAFLDYKPRRGVFGSEFVGFDNFKFLFSTEYAWRATRNTLFLNLLFITVGLVFALTIAWFIFQVYTSRMTRFYQTAMLLPNFISWVVVSYFVWAILKGDNGLANTLLKQFGFDSINWYSSPQFWPTILLLAYLWNSLGFSSLIYLSGMLSIDQEIFEAALMDGASKFRQFISITLPLILPLIVLNLLLALGHIFNADFGLFYQVTRNEPMLYSTTDVLDTYIYRTLVGSSVPGNVGMASAAQFYQSVVGFTLVIVANWAVKRVSAKDQDLSVF